MIDPRPQVQAQHRANYMKAMELYKGLGLVNYHDVTAGYQTAQREGFLKVATKNAAELTVESKILMMKEVLEKYPEYSTYWLYSVLGGDNTSAETKKKMLIELNKECENQTSCVVREYLDDRDRGFLKEVTTVSDTSGDTRKKLVG